MRNDLETAFRSLRRSPGLTAIATAVIALGIGAATAVFSIVDAVVLRGLPFDEHDRLVVVLEQGTHASSLFEGTTTHQTFLDWRARQQWFEALVAVSRSTFGLRDGDGHPQTVQATRATSEFFSVLRTLPMMGRTFTRDEETDGRHRSVILSYPFWQRQFGGATDVVGRTLVLNDQPWEIVGVMPPGFAYPVASPTPADVYAPLAFRDVDRVRGSNRNYGNRVIGRLKPGVTMRQASSGMDRLSRALDAEHPEWTRGLRAEVVGLRDQLVGPVRSWMTMLLGAVALVLLIACANVANLMLARATARGPDLAIRAAIGASRAAIARGLITEALLLSALGSTVGIALAWTAVRAVLPWLPADLPRVAGVAVDLRVLAVAIAAALGTGVSFGLLPALHSSRPDLSATLQHGGRSAAAGSGRQRLRSALVVAEVALAVVLVVGAGLFVSSFARLVSIDPGFDYTRVLTLRVLVPSRPGNPSDAVERGKAHLLEVLEAVRRVPGVRGAALANGGVPLDGNWSNTTVTVPGRGRLTGEGDAIERRIVSPGYLELLRVPLRRGRLLTDRDNAASQRVIVINETAARRYWPNQEAIGQRLTVNDEERIVVGVIGDMRAFGPEAPPRPEGYLPIAQAPFGGGSLVVRTAGNPLALLPTVKAAVWSVSKDQRFSGTIFTLEGYMDRLIARRRFTMLLLGLLGALALVISAVGIYGVMACLVAQRAGEIGVRMALGATRGSVMALVLGRAGLLMAIGLALGTTAAWLLGTTVRSFLFEVQPTDPLILSGAVLTLATAGLAASAVPARRAASVDPVTTMRQDR